MAVHANYKFPVYQRSLSSPLKKIFPHFSLFPYIFEVKLSLILLSCWEMKATITLASKHTVVQTAQKQFVCVLIFVEL